MLVVKWKNLQWCLVSASTTFLKPWPWDLENVVKTFMFGFSHRLFLSLPTVLVSVNGSPTPAPYPSPQKREKNFFECVYVCLPFLVCANTLSTNVAAEACEENVICGDLNVGNLTTVSGFARTVYTACSRHCIYCSDFNGKNIGWNRSTHAPWCTDTFHLIWPQQVVNDITRYACSLGIFVQVCRTKITHI